MDNHEEHIKLHVLYASSFLESKIWVNRPYGWRKWWFKLTGRPKPEYKTFEELSREINDHYNKMVESMSGVNPIMQGPSLSTRKRPELHPE